MLTYIVDFPFFQESAKYPPVGLFMFLLGAIYNGRELLVFLTIPIDFILSLLISLILIFISTRENKQVTFAIICGVFAVGAHWIYGISFIATVIGLYLGLKCVLNSTLIVKDRVVSGIGLASSFVSFMMTLEHLGVYLLARM